jgi:hypothetical protein
MYSVILIEKQGTLSQKQVKSFDKLHTSCNYRNNNNFELLHTWNINDETTYELHGKKHKKLNNDNNYVFSSIQNVFYGNLCIVKRVNNEPQSITIKEWEDYNGAFEVQPQEEMEETNEVIEIPYSVSDDKELTYEEYEDE